MVLEYVQDRLSFPFSPFPADARIVASRPKRCFESR